MVKNPFNIAPLTGKNNYAIWSKLMKYYLSHEGLWEVVEHGIDPATLGKDKEIESQDTGSSDSAPHNMPVDFWKTEDCNELAMLTIFVHLDQDLQELYVTENSAMNLWISLKNRYTKTTTEIMESVLEESNKLSYRGSIADMIRDHERIKRGVASAGISYEDLFDLSMINRIPEALRYAFVQILYGKESGERCELMEAASRVRDVEILCRIQAADMDKAGAAETKNHRF
ncbi:hypothetical protein IWW57_002700 [Coemansia sp. S610]|nr:hypothetical protein GGI06_000372 [Coemansia sp. S85]KAJ2027224.1 hypothetical protein IWW57_002700 [Coemansia sp. S610]